MDSKIKNRRLLGAVTLAVAVMVAAGWSFAPSWLGASAVDAAGVDGDRGTSRTQKLVASDNNVAPADYRSTEEQIQAMLNFALNLRTASEYTVFAEKGIVDNGNSEIRGNRGDALRSEGSTSTKDLSESLRAIKQLPCTDLTSTDLSGKTFGPGIYCLPTAELNGELTLDSAGNAAGTYLFRIAGNLDAKSGSSIRLDNGAQAGNVFFVADGAVIGDNASFRANILSNGDVRIGSGTTMTDKVLSMGTVELNSSNLVGGTTGTMEICKAQPAMPSTANNLSNQIFQFVVTGATTVGTAANPVKVAVGSCSAPFDVTAGPQTVTELNDGFLVTPPTGTFSGNFELIDVTNLTPSSPSTLGLVNLATRVANVNIVAGGIQQQIALQFTNRRTITGFVEICKYGLDSDVSGFFNYTIEDVYTINQRNPDIVRLQIFTVPVGFCSGPIAVVKGHPAPFPFLGQTASLAFISELPQANYRLERVDVSPLANANGPSVLDFIAGVSNTGADVLIPAANGGYQDTFIIQSATPAVQTIVKFYNRSLPGRIKVCKITADPVNIPVGTAFSFDIVGAGWTANPPGPPTPQALPFVAQRFSFDVLAGPAAQGGFCAFAPGLWAVGENVYVQENGLSFNNTTTLPLGSAATQLGLATSRIQASTPFANAPATILGFGTLTPNPFLGVTGLSPAPYGIIKARNTTAEIEFTNFLYRPAILKLCKNATGNIPAGTPFTFTIAPADPLTTLPYPVGTITVPSGSCTFVNGPFPANAQFPGVGLFNFGTSIVVTESAVPGVAVLGITSPTLTPVPNPNPPNFVGTLGVDLNNRRGTLTLNQILFITASSITNYYFNELTFLNGPASAPPRTVKARFDFDGDHASDIALFRPSDGNWYYSPSSAGGARAVHFGQAGDIPVAGDYDGDGTTDVAVYRNGQWFVLGSTAGFSSLSFGLGTDIPQVGDYDADGKADFAVYRQSNGSWYIMGSASGFRAVQFGIATDIPAAADFDGDGKTDPAVYRNGTWYINGSTAGFSGVQFGIAGDIPVEADYDGDGRDDVAVYRGGTWYVMGSAAGFSATQFGNSTDTPVPADYDGDGKTDVAVYRSSNTNWYILNSSQAGNAVGGFAAMQFGKAGDLLMPY